MRDYSARDQAVRTFGRSLIAPLRDEMEAQKIKKYSGEMRRMLRDRYYSYHGRITGFGYAMPRHAIYVHKGVGNGYPIETVRGAALGQSRSKKVKALQAKGYNSKAIGRYLSMGQKLGAPSRKPKPWFNPVLDPAIPRLADEIAKHDADIVASNVFIP